MPKVEQLSFERAKELAEKEDPFERLDIPRGSPPEIAEKALHKFLALHPDRFEQDSPAWHEAKYHQIACLAKTDLPLAKQVMQQYKVLYPEMGPAPWRSRLQALDASL